MGVEMMTGVAHAIARLVHDPQGRTLHPPPRITITAAREASLAQRGASLARRAAKVEDMATTTTMMTMMMMTHQDPGTPLPTQDLTHTPVMMTGDTHYLAMMTGGDTQADRVDLDTGLLAGHNPPTHLTHLNLTHQARVERLRVARPRVVKQLKKTARVNQLPHA